jgi:hypothetical protein
MFNHHYTTPKGVKVESSLPMTEADLIEYDEMIAGYEDWTDEQYEDWADQMAEDQDSDGYAWERKALQQIA